jgi:hypothetical protein
MRCLIMLEETSEGFAVQVPNLAIVTYGDDVPYSPLRPTDGSRSNRPTGFPCPSPGQTHIRRFALRPKP